MNFVRARDELSALTQRSHFAGRREDDRLITGAGIYGADISAAGTAHAVFVRSPLAHARISGIDVTDATSCPGVIAVLTGDDVAALVETAQPEFRVVEKPLPGQPNRTPLTPPLALGRVRFLGEAVVMVVAESERQAQDAADKVVVDLDELEPRIDPHTKPSSQEIWSFLENDLAVEVRLGEPDEASAIFARAARVTHVRVVSQRVAANPMEPRNAVAFYDADTSSYAIQVASQGPTLIRGQLCEMLGIEATRLRVSTPQVGGSFGSKAHAYPEYAAILLAARQVGRPVKWVSTRSEALLTDAQGRDTVVDAKLAMDAAGRFLAVTVECDVNIGAYHAPNASATASMNFWRCLAGTYATPVMAATVRCHHTNTVSTAPYRGAGRPEAALVMERLVDAAASEHGFDRVELRRRNFIQPHQFPYAAPSGVTYDSGEFDQIFRRALLLADHDGFEERRAASRANGRLRGLGIGCYVEIAGGPPQEWVSLSASGEGIRITSGAQSNGQGHETVFAELVAAALGVQPSKVQYVESDSMGAASGVGSFGSRSLTVVGSALIELAEELKQQAKQGAADLLSVARDEISYADGQYSSRHSNRTVSLLEAVESLGGLAFERIANVAPTFPNGCHVCEIEICPETGVSTLERFTAVDDIGVVINRELAEGQIRGGVEQGLGQVFLEGVMLDADSGQALTGSFMDYAMPRATDFPPFRAEFIEIPCCTNPLGTKGAAEAGTTGALAAGYSAVMDALAQRGVKNFDMPANPGRVWETLAGSGAAALARED